MPRWLPAAGNVSYETRLTHGFVIPAVFVLCAQSIAFDWAGVGAGVIFSVVTIAVVGQITHIAIARPLLIRPYTRRPVSMMPASG